MAQFQDENRIFLAEKIIKTIPFRAYNVYMCVCVCVCVRNSQCNQPYSRMNNAGLQSNASVCSLKLWMLAEHLDYTIQSQPTWTYNTWICNQNKTTNRNTNANNALLHMKEYAHTAGFHAQSSFLIKLHTN